MKTSVSSYVRVCIRVTGLGESTHRYARPRREGITSCLRASPELASPTRLDTGKLLVARLRELEESDVTVHALFHSLHSWSHAIGARPDGIIDRLDGTGAASMKTHDPSFSARVAWDAHTTRLATVHRTTPTVHRTTRTVMGYGHPVPTLTKWTKAYNEWVVRRSGISKNAAD